MASLYTASIDNNALAAATAETLLELKTTSAVRATLVQWWVEFDGVTASNTPVKLELLRVSGGTPGVTGTTLTPLKFTDFAPAAATTFTHTVTNEQGGSSTFEVLEVHRIPPTSGIFVQYPLGREIQIPVSGHFRIRLTAAQIVNATGGVIWEE